MGIEAKELWVEAPGRAGLRASRLAAPAEGEVLVEALYSAVSRGTERLVFGGKVPASEHERMRCPFQEGAFPGPLKYGYANVGRIVVGPARLEGSLVFSLSPHQDRLILPESAVLPLTGGQCPRRAALAANMETALTIVWDAGIGPGDRVAVIGAGVVGGLVAALAAAIPGTDVTLVDIAPEKAGLAAALGASFAHPAEVPADCDIVINASASEAGLQTAITAAGEEALVVEASWHGDRPVSLALGGAFHSRRLTIRSSQVGQIPPARRPRWTHRRRLELALALTDDPRLDVLISGETPFEAAADAYGAILDDPSTLAHLFRY